ncbi:hypothetical protein QBC39DRAFT_331863 [Podospora conica]|nr:hypothetical protein QBC39DRAFT_331863 [Schizothecium conicum]
MYSIWNGHEVQPRDIERLKFSVETLTPSNKRQHWVGKWWRIDGRSSALSQQQQQQQQQQQPPVQQQQQQPPAQQTAAIPQSPQTPPRKHSIPAAEGWLNVVDATEEGRSVDEWDPWVEDQKVLSPTSPLVLQNSPPDSIKANRLSMVISSEVTLTGLNNKPQDGPVALRYISLSKDRFLATVQALAIHRAYLELIHEGSPTAIIIKSTVHNRPCEVYLLRTSNAIDRQSAMAITHFPPFNTGATTVGSHTTVLISGYDAADVAAFTKILRSCTPTTTPTLPPPHALAVAFLEIEKERRFHLLRGVIREMQKTVHILGDDHNGEVQTPAKRREQLNQTVELFFAVDHLRTDGLAAWRDQLRGLLERTKAKPDAGMMGEYLGQLVARYEHRIARCEFVVQGVGLAYQMETARLSRQDTEIAIGDGKTMKAIAVMTMVFLPGTFIATMLAVPQIETALDGDHEKSFGDSKWLWYIVLAVPITVVTLLAYFAWEYCYKRRYLEGLLGGGRGKGSGEVSQGIEMWRLDLEAGNGGGNGGGNGVAMGGGAGGGNGGRVGTAPATP